jgi:hypothetical protein
MAATLDAGPSASLAMEKRHTGCAQNFSRTSDTACSVESSIFGPTNGLPHRAAWTASSPFLNASEQVPHVATATAILAASDLTLMFPMLDLQSSFVFSPASPYQVTIRQAVPSHQLCSLQRLCQPCPLLLKVLSRGLPRPIKTPPSHHYPNVRWSSDGRPAAICNQSRTTKFTNRPGTTISFTTVLSASSAFTCRSDFTSAISASADMSASATILCRSRPFS